MLLATEKSQDDQQLQQNHFSKRLARVEMALMIIIITALCYIFESGKIIEPKKVDMVMTDPNVDQSEVLFSSIRKLENEIKNFINFSIVQQIKLPRWKRSNF